MNLEERLAALADGETEDWALADLLREAQHRIFELETANNDLRERLFMATVPDEDLRRATLYQLEALYDGGEDFRARQYLQDCFDLYKGLLYNLETKGNYSTHQLVRKMIWESGHDESTG